MTRVIISLLLFTFIHSLVAQTKVDGQIINNIDNITLDKTATNDYISFYQKYISGLKNNRCAMFPSCSNYGLMVFKDKSFLSASLLTSDRLIRCSHDIKYYDTTYEYGYKSLLDYPFYKKIPNKILYDKIPKPHADNLFLKEGTDSTLLFINYLINNGEYNNALLEINRTIFLKKKINSSYYAKKLLCYRAINDLENGIFNYESLFPDSIKNDDVNYQACLLYYLTNNYDKFNEVITKIDKSNISYYNKIITIKGLTEIKNKNYKVALSLTKDMELDSYNVQLFQEINRIKMKREGLARVLSIIPGGGYLYAGHKGSALTSFIVNSLLAYSTYTSIKSKNYGLAGICGFLSLSFYIGNINGAGKSAKRYNEIKINNTVTKIENYNNLFIN